MERVHQDVVTLGEMEPNGIHGSEPTDLNNMNIEPNSFRVSTSSDIIETLTQKPVEVNFSAGEQKTHVREDEENLGENAPNQLVLNDHVVAAQVKLDHAKKKSFSSYTSRACPSGVAFVIQCDRCFKWRYIHTKEKYEQIRAQLSECPFYCETTCEWNANKSCEDPTDLTQEGSKFWAIDKPNIALPPPGWERLLRIRAEGGTRFADVYYESPSEMRFRSNVEIERYLEQHPEYVAQGARVDMFSFEIPRPLDEEYVKKRQPTSSHDANRVYDVNPISWAPPDGSTCLFGESVSSASPSLVRPYNVPEGNSSKKPRMTDESDAIIK